MATDNEKFVKLKRFSADHTFDTTNNQVLVKAASTTTAGKVQLATTAEATAGTNTTKAITPAGVAAKVASAVVAASLTQAGIVNLTPNQVLGEGPKIIDGVRISGTLSTDLYLVPLVDPGITPSIVIGVDAADGWTGTGAVLLGNGAKGAAGIAIGTNAGTTAVAGDEVIGISIGAYSQAGDNAVALGNNSNAFHDNSVVVGSGAASTAGNQVTLGNSSVTALRCQVTSITSLSDERDKKDWSYTIPGVEFLKETFPGYFTWDTRDGAKVGILAAGFSAQNLLAAQKKFNAEGLDLVSTDNPDKLEARYGNLIPVLVQSIINQQEEIDALKKLLQS